jgi:hypothetical protein
VRNEWNAIRSRAALILVRRGAPDNAERFQLHPAGRVTEPLAPLTDHEKGQGRMIWNPPESDSENFLVS